MTAAPGPRRGFFDLWSHFYDAPVVQRLTYRPVHDAVLRALRERGHARVLDLGCGTGLFTRRVQRELAPRRLVGCDFSPGMLRHAAAHPGPVVWVQGNALRLPFAAESFDAVLSTESFHWFPDPAAALAECFRVLSPGGHVFVACGNPPLELVSEVTRIGSRLLGEPLYWPTRARMRARVEAAGFRVELQRFVLRVPATLLVPPVLTVAERPRQEREEREEGAEGEEGR